MLGILLMGVVLLFSIIKSHIDPLKETNERYSCNSVIYFHNLPSLMQQLINFVATVQQTLNLQPEVYSCMKLLRNVTHK